MTPENVVDIDMGDQSSEDIAKSAGFDSVDDMAEAAKKHKSRVGYDGRKDRKIEELESKIEAIQEKQQVVDLGVSDDSDESTKLLARRVISLEREMDDIAKGTLIEEGDEDLEPYFEEARRLYPAIMQEKSRSKRISAYRRIARDLKAEADGAGLGEPPVKTTRGMPFVTTGRSPVSSPRRQISDDEFTEKLRVDLRAASKTEKAAVKAKYIAQRPHLFTD